MNVGSTAKKQGFTIANRHQSKFDGSTSKVDDSLASATEGNIVDMHKIDLSAQDIMVEDDLDCQSFAFENP